MLKLFGSIFVIVFLLTACTGHSLQNNSLNDIVTIEFYTWEASLTEQNAAVIAAFEERYPHIRVNIHYIADDNNINYTTIMNLLLLANVQVDVMMESSVGRMTNNVNQGFLIPLNEFMLAEGIVFDEIYSVSSYINGNYYGFPIDITPWFVMLNMDMLKEAGLPVPPLCWTWYDYLKYAKILTRDCDSGKVFGSYFHTWNNYYKMAMYSVQMGNALFNPDGSLTFENPAFRGWLQFRYNLENVYRVSVPLIDIRTKNMSYRSEFWGGRAAMLPTGAWMLAEIKDIESWPRSFQVAFAPLPRWPHGGVEGRTFSETKMLSIPVTAQHPEEAYKFIRFYTTEGAFIRAGGLVALQNADVVSNINSIIQSPYTKELYHLESLHAVFSNPNLHYNPPATNPVYDAEITTMLIEVSEKFLVGAISLDEAVNTLMIRGNEIMARTQGE
ncbi:MAG: extracellular solute-binding protein [Firmicutes bacterium]|nr:extracellular solute-binding protein [Bacillota bacterium]